MAKKGKELTLEEKLEQALVPAEEQPYEAPENWCWVRLLASFDNLTDSKKKIKQKDYLSEGKFAIVDQGQELIGGYTNDETMLCTHLKPVIVFGDHTRCVKYINFDFVQGADGVKILQPKNFWVERFFYYAMLNLEIPNLGYRRHFPLFNTFKIPLPPLAEQQRIVDRIESLFAKLDEAKEKIQNVLDESENRKNAILHKAFTGELTQKWREAEGVCKEDTWSKVTLDEVCESIFDGDHMPPPKAERGIPFLFISNVNTGHISFENVRFVPQEYYDSLTETRKPEQGDVLYTLVGSYGISVLVDTNKEFCFQRHMALLKPSQIDSEYLWYILQTKDIYEQATNIATGTAQLTVPIKGLRKISFNMAGSKEQKVIVDRLNLFENAENSLQRHCKATIENVDILKKSILAKAFRGELGTNDSSDEDAIELLKSVLEVNL